MNRPIFLAAVSLAVLVLLMMSLRQSTSASRPLVLFCAASNRAVVDAIRADYEREIGTRIETQYGPSQTLLTSIEVSRTGDLYLPADDSYLDVARDKKLVSEVIPLARMQVVVGIRKGNPLKIQSLSDLLRADVRLVQANPEVAAVGKLTREALLPSGQWEALDKHTVAYRSTVTEAANDVKLGAADAAIVYDSVLHFYPDLEAVRLTEFAETFANVKIGIVSFTTQSDEVRRFLRFLTASDRGLKRYAEYGFLPVDGTPWQEGKRP